MVYFVQASEGGPIKIGHTFRMVGRFYDLKMECGRGFRPLAIIDGDRHTEIRYQKMFAHIALGSEWFTPAPELLALIEELRSKNELSGIKLVPPRRGRADRQAAGTDGAHA